MPVTSWPMGAFARVVGAACIFLAFETFLFTWHGTPVIITWNFGLNPVHITRDWGQPSTRLHKPDLGLSSQAYKPGLKFKGGRRATLICST